MFDEHDNGQMRIGAQGDQIPLLALPADKIPVEHETTPAEVERERLERISEMTWSDVRYRESIGDPYPRADA